MRVTHISLCSQSFSYLNPQSQVLSEIALPSKIWFTLHDDAYEKLSGNANMIEL